MQVKKNYTLIQSLKKEEILALCVACSQFLASLEYLLPKPIPFFRFGLSNIIILLLIRDFRVRDIFLVMIVRVMATGLLHGTIASYVFLFSLFGAISALCMQLLFVKLLKNKLGLLGLSIVGAGSSNIVQIICSITFVFGKSSIIIAPYLLFLGFFSGIIVGLLSEYYYRNSTLLSILLAQYQKSIENNSVIHE